MGDKSAIEWTEASWNPLSGCERISPGCANCYAKVLHDKRHKAFLDGWTTAPAQYHRQFEVVQVHEDRLDQPLRWKRPRRIFVNSMSDLFHEDVPDAFIVEVFGVMKAAWRHTFQVLTKRAARMRELVNDPMFQQLALAAADRHRPIGIFEFPLPNVWLGVSVENQRFVDARIPLLLQTPAAVRFISAEPLLGPVKLTPFLLEQMSGDDRARDGFHRPPLDWVIVGGESGKGARPLWVPWVRAIKNQCAAAGVPCFVKQLGADVRDRNDAGFMGEWPDAWPDIIDIEDRVEHDLDGTRDGYQGVPVRLHLRSRKGGDPEEWPEDLRVREYPQVGSRT